MNEAIVMLLMNIGKGMFYGAIAAGIGYAKQETWETFDPAKFLKTMIIGGIVGAIVGSGHSIHDAAVLIGTEFNVDPVLVEGFLMLAITSFADQLVKLIARRTDLAKLWNAVKKFFGKQLKLTQ